MGTYKKTFVMNIVGAIGLIILGLAVLISKVYELSPVALIAVVAIYLVIAIVPALTARALISGASKTLRRSMHWTNWLLIGLWCVSVVGNVMAKQPLPPILAAALMFVVPPAINIAALRELLRSGDVSAA